LALLSVYALCPTHTIPTFLLLCLPVSLPRVPARVPPALRL
jgi:hypothetical protein